MVFLPTKDIVGVKIYLENMCKPKLYVKTFVSECFHEYYIMLVINKNVFSTMTTYILGLVGQLIVPVSKLK